MKIYTLVGKSGTGKSFHAMELCRRLQIEAIIDDGLFIYQNTVVAGVSAKRDATKIGAVKTALFQDDAIRNEVAAAIAEKKPASVLILGTSVGMTDKIILRLGLLPDEEALNQVERIFIEEITTEEERAAARQQRDKQGKHVIPAPALQLKRNFAGYFLDPLRIFRGKDSGAAAERTVVRPTYSYMGEYFVDERVLEDIVICVAWQMPGVSSVIRVVQDPRPEAFCLSVAIKVRAGSPIWETASRLQEEISEQVERMTAFNVTCVDVEVRAMEQDRQTGEPKNAAV
ncbi:MAG: ATP-binding protein [Firmicutes bacterium]|nr:ATP-binding protein [Bacillota bacterium]MDY5857210.1 ATP-binding protein [Anaerovoracaceae bacterium]